MYRTRLISYFFYFKKGVSILYSIGQMLKSAREESGVSLQEASDDLGIKELVLENIENGNVGCFKDIFELKDYLNSYAKYLGLNEGEIADKFQEYMFEHTSKIPVKDIEKQVMEQNKERQSDRIASPYSKPAKKYPLKLYIAIYLCIICLTIVIVVWSVLEIAKTRLSLNTFNDEVIACEYS